MAHVPWPKRRLVLQAGFPCLAVSPWLANAQQRISLTASKIIAHRCWTRPDRDRKGGASKLCAGMEGRAGCARPTKSVMSVQSAYIEVLKCC